MPFFNNQLAEFMIREKTPTNGRNGWLALVIRMKDSRDWVVFSTETKTRDEHELVYQHAKELRNAFPITMPGHFDDVPEPVI